MKRILAQLTLPLQRVQVTVDRLTREKAFWNSADPIALQAAGAPPAICTATGNAYDVQLLIDGLASEGAAGLLTVEAYGHE